jgi:hypothetical protein
MSYYLQGNWIGHMLPSNGLLKHIIGGDIEENTGREDEEKK